MEDGDIYRWKWADEDKRDMGSWGAYHCCSQWAVVRKGRLYDTYWYGFDNKLLSPDDVRLEFIANIEDLTEIKAYEIPYYKATGIVDMRHANNSSGPIYRRKGAEKDTEAMLDHVRRRKDDAKRNIRFETDRVGRLEEMEARILRGDLDEVYF